MKVTPTRGVAAVGEARSRRIAGIAVLTVALNLSSIAMAAEAGSDRIVRFDIPRQRADKALIEFAEQADVTFIFPVERARRVSANSIRGDLTLRAAIDKLLAGTGLQSRVQSDGALTVDADPDLADKGDTVSRRGFISGLIAVLSATATVDGRADQESENRPTVLSEIVVTAQKRNERLIDVPLSVTIVSANDLAARGATQFRDFADTVPGLSFTTAGAGFTQVSIRGITLGYDNSPTTAIYLDDVPYGSSTSFALSAQLAFDAALSDLTQIEILRGPQGTLYGASAMGGLIKYTTAEPDISNASSSARLGVTSTQDGGVGYNLGANVNMPLSSNKAAMRMTGYQIHDGGFIDNVALGRDDVNESDTYGGRIDLLLTSADALKVRLSAFAQNISRDGEGTADYAADGSAPNGELGQFRPYPLGEAFDQQFRLVSATVSFDFGFSELTSISSFQTIDTRINEDISFPIFVPFLATLGRELSALAADPTDSDTDKFTQEFRLVSLSGKTLEWLIGAFYTSETSDFNQAMAPVDLNGNPVPNDLFTYRTPSQYEDQSLFGNLTWNISRNFNVTGGIRHSRNDQSFTQIGSGLLGLSHPRVSASEDVTTYLANARYRFGDHATAYARFATGYRPGGPNYVTIDPVTGEPGPATFEPDELESFEVGVKAESSEGRFALDLALFDIDWSNPQVTISRGGFGAIINAPGGAAVRGSELTLSARPTDSLRLALAVAYQDAELSAADADVGGAKGDRLPGVPDLSGSFNLDYEFAASGFRPFVGTTVRYVSDRTVGFDGKRPPYLPEELPDYTSVDFRGGFALGKAEVQLFVRNAFDERGQISVLTPQFGYRVGITQPRTYGINVNVNF